MRTKRRITSDKTAAAAHRMRGELSLVEMLIVVFIIVAISAIVLVNLLERTSRAELEAATRQIATTFREGQSRAIAQEEGTVWGVRLENSTATAPAYALFRTSYSTANILNRKSLPAGIRFSSSSIPFGGFLDITFAQITGIPSVQAFIALELVGRGGVEATSSVAVSSAGLISF